MTTVNSRWRSPLAGAAGPYPGVRLAGFWDRIATSAHPLGVGWQELLPEEELWLSKFG